MIAVLIATIFFIWALIRGRNLNYAVTFAIGILLAWIPQGLPLTVTFLLALSGRRMLQKNVVVKDLHGIETLGAISLLATDKTGTLTKNEMAVAEFWLNEAHYGVIADGERHLRPLKMDVSGVAQMLHICATCTRARMEEIQNESGEKTKQISGSPTERGLLEFAASKLKNFEKLNELFPKVFEVPFTSDTKYHLTIHRKGHSQGGLTLHLKGAPEIVWSACKTILFNGKPETITDKTKRAFMDANERMCGKGQRVLAFAMLQLTGDKYPDNYRFSYEKKNFPIVRCFTKRDPSYRCLYYID
jgi:sodium/potassium-transporting ATPase subunit alpha